LDLSLQIKTPQNTLRNEEKQRKTHFSPFLAFFRPDGKCREFYAILRGYKPCINRFVSANKAKNPASRHEAK